MPFWCRSFAAMEGWTWPATMSCSKEHWINGAEERKGSGMAVAVRADIDGQTDGTERRAEFFSLSLIHI